jgi:hypothetical protein
MRYLKNNESLKDFLKFSKKKKKRKKKEKKKEGSSY